jgi:ubiquinone/menaquinone biosynthesis C-methylase UbiE/DNA-binding NarL/FixJ family response regulator
MSLENIKKHTETKKSVIIVVVDDDISHLHKLQRALSQEYIVLTSTGGVEAIRLIKSLNTIHVLIISNDMTPENEILRFVNESIPDADEIIKILISNSPDDKSMVESGKIGRIDGLLTKPVSPDSIRNEVAYLLARNAKEKRAVMRVNLEDTARIHVDGEADTEIELVNISESGMFLRTLSRYPHGMTLPFRIGLPDGKNYTVSARVVRTDKERGGIGVEFVTMDRGGRTSLMRSLADSVTLKDLSKLKARYPFLNTEEMVPFTDKTRIETFLLEAMKSETEIVALQVHMPRHEILKMTGLVPLHSCTLEGEALDVKFKTSDLIFVSFQLGYATYNFETTVYRLSEDGKRMECLYPRVIFYSEKRHEKRIEPVGDLWVEIPLPSPHNDTIKGRIADISPGGVCFLSKQGGPMLLKGTPLDTIRIYDGDKLQWQENGEIRYVTWQGESSSRYIRYGIQLGIARMSIQSTQAPQINFEKLPTEDRFEEKPRFILSSSRKELASRPPEVIRVENKKGEEIVGLLDSSMPLDGDPLPVVLIPPAFGKTKETLFSLALTLIENFYLLGKPLAVLRYDGIRRKGESFKDPEAAEPPYELINADFTQGASDIKTMVDWLKNNPRFRASSITLISFSLSALEARIVLRDEAYRKKIDYWISCLGTPEFRDLMTRINCGLDFFEQYRLGIQMGVMPVLGNLVNVDPYVGDGVAHKVATIDQAKEDMRLFDIPITWIYGQHDKWVKTELVRDIMSVQVDSPREVISMPTGHNARTSQEALQVFGTITSLVYRFLHHKMITPVLPNKKSMEIFRRAEKDRLPARKLKDRKAYWQRYLIGEENVLGFDIMGMSDDYQKLMHDQVEALDPAPSDRVLDLGGGTGIFVEHLLENGRSLPAHVAIADLIPEALKQARVKLSAHPKLLLPDQGKFELMCLDLEMSRFLPIARFINGEVAHFKDLADRIENLSLESAIKIQEAYSPRLHRILRGQNMDTVLMEWLQSQFDLREYRTILDFNQAARYVRGLLLEKPTFQRLLFPGELRSNLHLPVKQGFFNKILMSLVLSYIFDPAETLYEVRRVIAPGGRLVLSSMRPDTDASGPFTRLMDKIDRMPEEELPTDWSKPRLLDSLRSFLNDAQALFDLEEAGTFDFFDPEKLDSLLEETGWEIVRNIPTFGDPPQGYIVVAEARGSNGS